MTESEAPTEILRPEKRNRLGWLFGDPRALEDLNDDPALLFQAAYLVGSASVVAHWLSMRPDQESQQMGAKLAEACTWFYEDAKPRKN
jgi:hypothetical protein